MFRQVREALVATSFLCLASSTAVSQLPVGELGGTVFDETNAALLNARVTATNQATGLSRTAVAGDDGSFTLAVLPPGAYEVTAEARGFQTPVRTAVVHTGQLTAVNLKLPVKILQQFVDAVESAPLVDYQSNAIGGVVSRLQIENLPLNGRDFLQLAALQAGVTTSADAGVFTRQFDVSLLGAPPDDTRVTMDGSPIINPILGGAPQNFSQEVVHEFRVSTVNFDVATGLTGAGAINAVTRSASNGYHGSAFLYFRDHNLAAYPALRREPANPDPFFARRQAGFHMGGPLKKNRVCIRNLRTQQPGRRCHCPAACGRADGAWRHLPDRLHRPPRECAF